MQSRLSPTWSWSGFPPSLPPRWVSEEDGDRDGNVDGLSFLSCCQFLAAARGKAHPGLAQALSPSRRGRARAADSPPLLSCLPSWPRPPRAIFKFSTLCTACVQGRLIPLAQRWAAAPAQASPRSPSLQPSTEAPAPGDTAAEAGAEPHRVQEPSAALSRGKPSAAAPALQMMLKWVY